MLDGAAAFGSLALLGLEPDEVADVEELRLARAGCLLRALAPEAATLRARLGAAEAVWCAALAERSDPGARTPG